jgi:glycosyltransferase involved in cell wall biosynthesis
VIGKVTVDMAGAQMGGAARYAVELFDYLARTGRQNVQVIGAGRRVGPSWLVRREAAGHRPSRRVALNNVSFVTPGGPRWTLLRNALHFMTDAEASRISPTLLSSVRREATVVRLAAQRADVLVVPSAAMAERVVHAMPRVSSRVVVRPHPVSANFLPPQNRDPAILCPVLFAPYKRMDEHIEDLLAALAEHPEYKVRVRLTAFPADLPPGLALDPRLDFLGSVSQGDLQDFRARSQAIFFPTSLESFGYPLAEARVSGQPIIAQDTTQNREIAGAALCGYAAGDAASLHRALERALVADITPDPAPFDPDAYFDWILGSPS